MRPCPTASPAPRTVLRAILAFVVALSTTSCFEFGKKPEEAEKNAAAEAVLVRPSSPRRRALDRTLEISGEVVALTRTEIAAKVSGLPVVALAVDLGATVKAGDLLCKLDDVDAKRDLEEAGLAEREAEVRVREAGVGLKELEAQFRGQESVVSQAQKAYDRAKAQAEKGALAAETLENASYKLESERSMKERLGFQIEKAKVNQDLLARASDKTKLLRQKAEQTLAWTEVRAPFGGIVAARTARLGAIVQSSGPLFEIFDPESLAATSQITQRDLPFVQQGQTVEIRSDAYPKETFQGEIQTVSPVVDQAAGTIPIRIRVKDRERLKPGLFISGRIVLERRENVLVLPKKAVLYERERPLVFKILPGAAAGTLSVKRVFFREGLSDRDEVEAVFDAGQETLEASDRLVLVGQDRLRDGDAVALEPATGAESAPSSRPAGG